MASVALLRCCRGGGHALFRSQFLRGNLSVLLRPDVNAKTFALTPVTLGNSYNVPEYFRARRGPFTPAEKQGKHMLFTSTTWKIERILAASMLGILPASLFIHTPAMEFIFTTSIFLHAFWAFDHVLTDYLKKFVPFITLVWYAISIVAFAGLMNLNFNDVGVFKAIGLVWQL